MTEKHKEKTQLEEVENAAPDEAVTQAEIPADGADAEANQGEGEVNRIEQLEQQLAEAQSVKEEYYNRMLRIQADFENFRRRSRQEFEQAGLSGEEKIIKKILPVLDSMERALGNMNGSSSENAGWLEGVQLIYRQFQNILTTEGLEVIAALDQPFDPQVHEAVLQEVREGVTEPTVVEELQKGYKYKGKLIRPSMVKVAVPG